MGWKVFSIVGFLIQLPIASPLHSAVIIHTTAFEDLDQQHLQIFRRQIKGIIITGIRDKCIVHHIINVIKRNFIEIGYLSQNILEFQIHFLKLLFIFSIHLLIHTLLIFTARS